MYYRDHAPPHFHAFYEESESTVSIETSQVLEGRLPRRARTLVAEWVADHREELRRDWDLARAGQPLMVIAGLD